LCLSPLALQAQSAHTCGTCAVCTRSASSSREGVVSLLLLLCQYYWHTHSHAQSPFRAIRQRDITAVPTHNRARDGHTEPDSARLAAACCFEPYKRLEDALHIRRSNARAIVVDANGQHVPLLGERHLGVVRGGSGLILADSHLMLRALEELGVFVYKRYQLYQKDLV
jgi:hypothetical protein